METATHDAVEVETVVVEEAHPLLDISSQVGYWKRWKDRWEKCTSAEERYGLLHIGFMVRISTPEEWEERILFYISCADSWRHGWLLHRKEDHDVQFWFSLSPSLEQQVGICEMRRVVARKAFETIANAVFKNRNKSGDLPSWLWIIEYPVLVDKVLWFFRLDERHGIQNLGHSFDAERDMHVRKRGGGFILALAKLRSAPSFFQTILAALFLARIAR